jgi:DNA-binding MarR family transcriptional regulator
MVREAEIGPDERRAFYDALQELLRVYQFRDRDRACYGAITPNQCYALEAVERAGGLAMCALASALGLHKSNASRLADSLEEKGFLRREVDPADGRGVRLAITREGRRAHAAIRARVEAAQAEILAGHSAVLRRDVVRLLGELAREAARRIAPCERRAQA